MKKIEGAKKYTLLIDIETLEELDSMFAGYGISRNELIRTILRRTLRAMKTKAESLSSDDLITVNQLIDSSVESLIN